ncbi:MAG: DUF3429 domain-containing protein [Hyphomicrobiaceae bacterium]
MQFNTNERTRTDRIPVIALLLGWAGVLPFLALVISATVGPPGHAGTAMAALLGYGSIILSFMGGVIWGLEMNRARSQVAYVASILPALTAAAAMVLQAPLGILLLLCGFAGLLAYDLALRRSGWAPDWYPGLRWQLTIAVVALLTVALLFARQP